MHKRKKGNKTVKLHWGDVAGAVVFNNLVFSPFCIDVGGYRIWIRARSGLIYVLSWYRKTLKNYHFDGLDSLVEFRWSIPPHVRSFRSSMPLSNITVFTTRNSNGLPNLLLLSIFIFLIHKFLERKNL